MKSVLVYTSAYNAEKTLRRCVESVLRQKHCDFKYFLLDNGSTDSTGDIIREYAAQDPRIMPVFHNENVERALVDYLPTFQGWSDKYDFFTALDADDEYDSNFFSEAIAFMCENNLDIVACGSDFIKEATGNEFGYRKVEKEMVIFGELFAAWLPKYHMFVRTSWGKLYRSSLLRRCDFTGIKCVTYGADTLLSLEAFRNSNRAGILSGTHHKYYTTPDSVSYKFDNKRINSDRILDDVTRSFLISKCGSISPENDALLYKVYFFAIKDTIKVILNAQIPDEEKLAGLLDIFTSEKTKRLIEWVGYTYEIRVFLNSVSDWLLSQKECRDSYYATIIAKILAAMYPDISQFADEDSLKYLLRIPDIVRYVIDNDCVRILERLQSWRKRHTADEPALTRLEIAATRTLYHTDDNLFLLLVSIRKNRPLSSMELGIDTQLSELLKRHPMVECISVDFATIFSSAVCSIIKGDYLQALQQFISDSQNVDIADNDVESYFMLGQNLSAAAEDAGAFIYFKKVWISYLLDCSRNEEACKELDEFTQMLPDDEDCSELRKRLIGV